MNGTIAAVLVTYNRKELLLNCINSILDQTIVPNAIFIIDNCSTDRTPEFLYDMKLIHSLPDLSLQENQTVSNIVKNGVTNSETKINYVRKYANDGGAGGFYEGMKQAYESGYDWIWMMDDDGKPSTTCLEALLSCANSTHLQVLNSIVRNVDKPEELAFALDNQILTVRHAEESANSAGMILGKANPFNGTLIHRHVIQKVGYVKREMFIWGDETEYMLRIRANGFEYATNVYANYFHPENKSETKKILLGLLKVPIKPEKLEMNYYRNIGFLNRTYKYESSSKIIFKYFTFFMLTSQWIKLFKFILYYIDGYTDTYRLKNIN